jgi:putative flippase GtrA
MMVDASRLLRYIFVGGSTAGVLAVSVITLVEALHFYPTLASTIGCILAVCYNYVLHYHWTFRTTAPHGKVLAKYIVMCLVGFVINTLVMYFGTKIPDVHYLIVQAFAAGAMVCWNLFASYLWVFNNSTAKRQGSATGMHDLDRSRARVGDTGFE